MATSTQMGGPILAAMNTVNDVEVWQFWGDNATVGTSFEGINGSDATEQHCAILGEDVDVLSASTADDGAPVGTGALTLTVDYLDSSFNQASETVTLNGQTAVELTDQTITFINDVYIASTGTGLAAAGAIDVAQPGGNTLGTLDAGATHWNNTKCMIPANSKGYVYGFWADILDVAAGAGTAEVALQIAEFGTSGVANSETWQNVAVMTLVEADDDVVAATGGNASSNGFFEFPGGVPFIVPAKCMIRLAAKAGVAVAVVAGFSVVVHGSGAGTTSTDS